MKIVMPLDQNRRIRRSAFTLTEVMTAMAIIALIFTVLNFGMAQSFSVLRTCRESLRATQILEEKMETVRLYKWEDINTPGFIPATISEGTGGVHYTGTLTVSSSGCSAVFPGCISEAYSNDVRLVVAKLDWTTGRISHHKEMRTFVSKYGLQNYVYRSSPPGS
jgi:prepilin-type N-terminal cleavage/methylation domain-containing protein